MSVNAKTWSQMFRYHELLVMSLLISIDMNCKLIKENSIIPGSDWEGCFAFFKITSTFFVDILKYINKQKLNSTKVRLSQFKSGWCRKEKNAGDVWCMRSDQVINWIWSCSKQLVNQFKCCLATDCRSSIHDACVTGPPCLVCTFKYACFQWTAHCHVAVPHVQHRK